MRKKGLEPHLLGAGVEQGSKEGEIRHHIKAPSWHKEALAGRVLSEGWQGPTCARWRSRLAEDGMGLPPMERPV